MENYIRFLGVKAFWDEALGSEMAVGRQGRELVLYGKKCTYTNSDIVSGLNRYPIVQLCELWYSKGVHNATNISFKQLHIWPFSFHKFRSS